MVYSNSTLTLYILITIGSRLEKLIQPESNPDVCTVVTEGKFTVHIHSDDHAVKIYEPLSFS